MRHVHERTPRDQHDKAAAAAPNAAAARPDRSRGGLRAALLRLHFYAGVFVAPFLLLAALTGLAYTLTPQLDRLAYGNLLTVDRVAGEPRPLAAQVAVARAAYPEGTIASVITPPGPEDTTRLVLSLPELGDRQRTVYVDPYTAEVKGELTTTWGATPLTTWLDDLHRNLHLGEVGRLYSEAAASWLWVIAAGGVALWLGRVRKPRSGSVRRFLLPERSARGVRRTRGLHATLGVWLAVGLFFLSATGLTWSAHAGGRFGQLLDAVGGRAPELDTELPGTAAGRGRPGHTFPPLTTLPDAASGDGHIGHGAATRGVDGDPATFDAVLAIARDDGLTGSVVLTPPDGADRAWTVAQDDDTWPVRYDRVAVDAAAGEVTARSRWADYPVPAKLSRLGVQAHKGVLFGAVNRIVLAAVASGLVVVILWGYRMWWQRRPRRADRTAAFGRAPARGAWRQLPRPLLVLGVPAIAAIGWALPVLGITLLGFLVADAVVGLAKPARR
ncbi:PepSY-associated TM helix domain-containing protein [Catellatospora citrea]|uniref:Membrane protein n=1 Tax=Catellatospora citrea TaxID=53366 RepID=A0A8J3KM05_9ACTN|nr:PepSY domain-containing protein [Catellatospora citrea]RKE05384.1 putative iron-regulated membrane protein [Catellatospora citrea]GIF98314.1 membrane protein [Catellatospora citrea]